MGLRFILRRAEPFLFASAYLIALLTMGSDYKKISPDTRLLLTIVFFGSFYQWSRYVFDFHNAKTNDESKVEAKGATKGDRLPAKGDRPP